MVKVTPILGERLCNEEGSGHLPSREIAEHQFGLRLGVELHVVNFTGKIKYHQSLLWDLVTSRKKTCTS